MLHADGVIANKNNSSRCIGYWENQFTREIHSVFCNTTQWTFNLVHVNGHALGWTNTSVKLTTLQPSKVSCNLGYSGFQKQQQHQPIPTYLSKPRKYDLSCTCLFGPLLPVLIPPSPCWVIGLSVTCTWDERAIPPPALPPLVPGLCMMHKTKLNPTCRSKSITAYSYMTH